MIDEKGYHLTTFPEYRARFIQAFRVLFGPNIQTGIGTLGGEFTSIPALAIAEVDKKGNDDYDSFNESKATGDALDHLAAITGIVRKEKTKSLVTLTFVCDPNANIPRQTLVSDKNSLATFSTLENANSGASGTVEVVAEATVDGPVVASPDTLTKIRTPFAGFQKVTNPTAAKVGEEEETDEELRVRRRAAIAVAASASEDALLANLLQLSDVISAKVRTNETDPDVPPGIVNCLVENGSDADIADVIRRKKGFGILTQGGTTVAVKNAQGAMVNVSFDRPARVPISISMTLQYTNEAPGDIEDTIRQKLVTWGLVNLTIGVSVLRYSLVCPISMKDMLIIAFQIGRNGNVGDSNIVDIAYNELATISAENISIAATKVDKITGAEAI